MMCPKPLKPLIIIVILFIRINPPPLRRRRRRLRIQNIFLILLFITVIIIIPFRRWCSLAPTISLGVIPSIGLFIVIICFFPFRIFAAISFGDLAFLTGLEIVGCSALGSVFGR